ncbi:MAG: FliM/FliN family flagellar motor switch protein [Rhodanobacteraceae bacterium]
MHPRYGWLGATRKAVVREALAACVDAWLRDWSLQCEVVTARITEIELAGLAISAGSARMLESEQGSLLLSMEPDQEVALGLHLAAIPSAAGDAMAQEVANAALADLMSRIGARTGFRSTESETVEAPWPEALTRSEWGAMALRLAFGEVELVIAMDRTFAGAIAPERATASAPESRVQTLQTTQVPITAVLDFGEISARDLAGLHAGEVLVSERKIGQLAELRIGNSRVASAAIGAIGNHLAVVVTAASDSKETL